MNCFCKRGALLLLAGTLAGCADLGERTYHSLRRAFSDPFPEDGEFLNRQEAGAPPVPAVEQGRAGDAPPAPAQSRGPEPGMFRVAHSSPTPASTPGPAVEQPSQISQPTAVAQPTAEAAPPPGPARPAAIPFGVPVPGKPGFVTSPHSPTAGFVDVTGMQPGDLAKDPYSGKAFRVP